MIACECRHISGSHLVPPKNNVCEPEPENDFCDVGILSQSQFSSNSPRTTARLYARYSLRGALEFHSIMESDWPRRNKSHYVTEIVSWLRFTDVIFGRDKRQPEISLCLQATFYQNISYFSEIPCMYTSGES